MSEIKDIPKHWKVKKLGEVCEVVTGTTPPTADKSNYGNNIPFFKPPHLWDSLIIETEEMLSNSGASKARVVPPNTVLVTCIGNLGRTGLVKKKAAFNQQINAILENDILTGKFIFYQAQSPNFKNQLEKLATGTTVSIVNKGNFETIFICIPPLPEQHAIVAKIEELLSELENGKQQLLTAQQQLKVYRQSLLKWAFEGKLTNKNVKEGELPKGWKTIKLSEVSNLITKGASPKWQGINYVDDTSQVLFVTSENVRENFIDISKPKYLELAFNNKQKRSILKRGDVLLNIVGASIGRAAIYNLDFNANINQAVAVIKLSDQILNKFVSYYLNSNKALSYYNLNKVDVARANLSLVDVGNIELALPSLSEQQLIISELESKLTICDKIEETISQSMQQAETLKQSILKKAFEGKLLKV